MIDNIALENAGSRASAVGRILRKPTKTPNANIMKMANVMD